LRQPMVKRTSLGSAVIGVISATRATARRRLREVSADCGLVQELRLDWRAVAESGPKGVPTVPDWQQTRQSLYDEQNQDINTGAEGIGRPVAATSEQTGLDGDISQVRIGEGTRTKLPVSAVLRPLASGLPFGLFGLVVAATMLGAQALLFLPMRASLAIGVVLIPTAMAQLVAGVAALPSRDVISATLMMVFSGVWLGTGLVFIISPPYRHVVLGFWCLALCPVIACLISAGTAKLALSLVPMIGLRTLLVTGIWLIVAGPGSGRRRWRPVLSPGRCRPVRGHGPLVRGCSPPHRPAHPPPGPHEGSFHWRLRVPAAGS